MEDNMSFPVWFNDSLIEQNKISKITRKKFADSTDNQLTNQIVYQFNKKGNVVSVEITSFYDLLPVSKTTIAYKNEKDINGYCKIARIIAEGETDDRFLYHEPLDNDSDKPEYLEDESLTDLIFIPNKEDWGIMAISTNYDLHEDDWVVFGTPSEVHKKFHVSNTVETKSVTEVIYSKNKSVKQLLFDNYPFNTKRDLKYTNQQCVGFTDSLFTGEAFLNSVVTTFELNQLNLPVSIISKKYLHNGKQEENLLEQIHYDHYE